MGKRFEIKGDDISDGYHTFTELYEHRCLLFIRLCALHPSCSSWKRDQGTVGWFVLYYSGLDSGQISYHIPEQLLPVVEKSGIPENPYFRWDGHMSDSVLERLKNG